MESQQWERLTMNGGDSTMLLRPKKDTPLQVEKNSGSSEG